MQNKYEHKRNRKTLSQVSIFDLYQGRRPLCSFYIY